MRYGRTKSPHVKISIENTKSGLISKKTTQAHYSPVACVSDGRFVFCLFRFAGDIGARQSGSDDEQMRMPSTMTEKIEVTTSKRSYVC